MPSHLRDSEPVDQPTERRAFASCDRVEEILCRGYLKNVLGGVAAAAIYAGAHFFRPLGRTYGADGYDPLLVFKRFGELVEAWSVPQNYTLGFLSLFLLGLALNRFRERTGTLSYHVLSVTFRYDALNRVRTQTLPDAADFGGQASMIETLYAPLARMVYDEEDNDTQSPYFDTPTITRRDGLGRIWAIERLLDLGGDPAILELAYDELGRLRGYIDPAGNEKVQQYDLLGRVISVSDPNSGETSFVYDAGGNRIEERDARDVVVRTSYDGANRPMARWDDGDVMVPDARMQSHRLSS